ncbi:MAG: hypothetical protein MUO76_18010, partial [Anaerolineaceae bacterium]|nr:hypothetical protein [Anaerolineaceae bacterium]
MTEKKLEERISFPFDFYGDIYKIAFADDHGLYVPVRDICGSLGVDTQAQTRRIRRSSTLSEGLARVKMATDYQEGVRMREVLCLNVELIPEWISGVDESRISEESLPAIIRLKKEFSLIVKAYFRGAIIPEDLKAEIDSSLPTALRDLYEQAEKMALYVHDVRHDL